MNNAFAEARAVDIKRMRQRRLAARFPATLADLQRIAAVAQTPVVKLKPGFHEGHPCVPWGAVEPPLIRYAAPKTVRTPRHTRADQIVAMVEAGAKQGVPVTAQTIRTATKVCGKRVHALIRELIAANRIRAVGNQGGRRLLPVAP